MDTAELSGALRATIDAIDDATGWANEARNARRLSQDQGRIDRILRRSANEARRLEQTFKRPTCVGVFGPSQAGKSYLISVLARKKGQETMIAKFAGPQPEIDFVTQINPFGGKEATGLVTRFTLHGQASPAHFPVCMRLLSQGDIVKIIVNSYFQDGDQEDESPLDAQALDAHLKTYEARCGAGPADVLTEDDVFDIREYIARNSGGAPTVKAFETSWKRIARIAPRLRAADRPGFLSILWGGHATYTAIFSRLIDALTRLDFADEAFCGMDGLMPSSEGILNVATLQGLLDPTAATLQVCTASGAPVALARPIVTALAMELRIVCRDESRPFLAHTDLLDFPGYRSRRKENLERAFRDSAGAAAEFYLRGKVDYLFQSYTADLELTSLVLCLPDSNLEVATLPRAVENWIEVTHGATPERREGKPTLLFFALTKFDRHLMEAVGEEAEPASRFETRLHASLIEPFGKTDTSWPKRWTPGSTFKNLFWVRNPNFKSEHVIRYEGRLEVEILPERRARIEELREAFVGSALVQTYFRDPPAAWDQVMLLNDGGVGYLTDALGVVSTPDLKLIQVGARLKDLRREVVEILSPYYVDDDYAKRRAQRLAVIDDKVFPGLDACARRTAFGSALRGMMVNASDLYAAISEALSRPDESGGGPFGKAAQQRQDRWTGVANAALDRWGSMMFARSEDPVFSRRVGVAGDVLKEMVAEFSAAARRVGIAERIAAFIRQNNSPSEQVDSLARKISLIAERRINRFVAELDFDALDAPTQRQQFGDDLNAPAFLARKIEFDTLDMPHEARDFALSFMSSWADGFRATVARNAMAANAGVEDPVQNARLGVILKAVAA